MGISVFSSGIDLYKLLGGLKPASAKMTNVYNFIRLHVILPSIRNLYPIMLNVSMNLRFFKGVPNIRFLISAGEDLLSAH